MMVVLTIDFQATIAQMRGRQILDLKSDGSTPVQFAFFLFFLIFVFLLHFL